MHQLVKHETITRNYGLKGGWLHCVFWAFPNGEPTGYTSSQILHP